jgi:hypothetical protein
MTDTASVAPMPHVSWSRTSIQPSCEKNRKGTLGSYYAVRDYADYRIGAPVSAAAR